MVSRAAVGASVAAVAASVEVAAPAEATQVDNLSQGLTVDFVSR
jgi:hypothetical protein